MMKQTSLNGAWHITQIGGQTIDLPKAQIQFDSNELRVSATVGCNRMFGGYQW